MPIRSSHKEILIVAVASRFAVFAIQALSTVLLVRHDAGAFKPLPHLPQPLIDNIFNGLRSWDAQHFLYIAKNGYTLETSLAFFPLLPFLIRGATSTIFRPVRGYLDVETIHTLAGVLVNFFAFIQCAILVYRVSCLILRNERLAYRAALLFCINPASIFMTAIYTESVFMMLTLYGQLLSLQGSFFLATACFCLGTTLRSNGATNVLFFLYPLALKGYVEIRKLAFSNEHKMIRYFRAVRYFLDWLAQTLSYFVIVLTPYLVFQMYGYALFCTTDVQMTLEDEQIKLAERLNVSTPLSEVKPEWCNATLPLPYSHIQAKFWDVGFMKFWTFRNIPNFALATPVVLLAISGLSYFISNWLNRNEHKRDDVTRQLPYNERSALVLIYSCHMAFLLFFGLGFMNVQVLTRFLFCSSPYLYWWCAVLTSSSTDHTVAPADNSVVSILRGNILSVQLCNMERDGPIAKLVLVYFLLYFTVGTSLFANFLPFV